MVGVHRAPEVRRPLGQRFGDLVSAPLSWVLALVVAMAGGALLGLIPATGAAERSPVVVSPTAESSRATELLQQFPGGNQAPVILLVTRTDGGVLSPDDLAAAEQARARMTARSTASAGAPPIPPVPSADGKAALAPVPLDPTLTGFALSDEVKELRAAAREGLPGELTVNVTGGPAFGADIANSFSGANFVLLGVTVGVVALLLIVTYRSPVLWLVPLLVISLADRVAAVLGSAIAEAVGLGGDGSTSGTTSVLVPGSDQPAESGAWYRIADWVSGHAGRVTVASIMVLGVLATGLAGTPVGLSLIDQFRVSADSIDGFRTLAAHFPSGVTDPTRVVAPVDAADAVTAAIERTPGVASAAPAGTSDTGLTQWQVVINAEPASPQSFEVVTALRNSVHQADPDALVGGTDAQALDARNTAVRDRQVVMPAVLIVVLAVLYALLRAVLAPPVLAAATVLSTLAALGMGGWVSVHLLGFPALDNSVPLFAFLFLVALGIDYTIFLVTRAGEETPLYGTRGGIVRAVSATGGVITSAGIVLAAVFCVLGVLPLIFLTQMGIIVGLGILLDTFVVRTVVIPALFTLIGPRIWWPAFRREDIERTDRLAVQETLAVQ
ncbi:MAG: MMPL family transporter [Mycobacteriaceae bacterium]|nr:MMPL family transporter [Mycobacteriaceae bacterium]